MRAYAMGGHHRRALEMMPVALRVSGRNPWALGLLAWTHGQAGRADLAAAVFDEMEGRSRHEFMGPFWLATAAEAAGRRDAALRMVQRAMDERDPLVVWGRISRFWQELRTDPRVVEWTHRAWA
jgi:hypothetical protein